MRSPFEKELQLPFFYLIFLLLRSWSSPWININPQQGHLRGDLFVLESLFVRDGQLLTAFPSAGSQNPPAIG